VVSRVPHSPSTLCVLRQCLFSPATSEIRGPQVSILGPLLFLIYINDLPQCIVYASCHLFSDDAKLLKSVFTSNDCTQLQLDLLSLEQWCNTWRLNLNQRKCTHLKLSLSNQAILLQSVEYKICETTLNSVTRQRSWGYSDKHLVLEPALW